ncbi:MAG: hypothetical protein Q9216_004972 [Gyalolechia sp. 2 TL-2023]
MLSKILANIKNFLPWLSPGSSETLHNTPDRQLQSELAEAALAPDLDLSAMVATRSQDRDSHAQPAEESQSLPGRETPIPSSSKRKAPKAISGIRTPISGTTKRRKLDNAPSSSDNNTPKTFAAVVIPDTSPGTACDREQNVGEGNANRLIHEEGTDVSPSGIEEGPLRGSRTSNSGAYINSTERREGSRLHGFKEHDELVTKKQRAPTLKTMESSSARSSVKSRKRGARMESRSIVDPSPRASSRLEGFPTKSQHKRFEGEEAIPVPSVPLDLPAETSPLRDAVEGSEVELSDDEAPDVVAQSTGLERARSAAAETAKAVEAQRAVEKQKRKERNKLLERQAKATKKEVKETKSKDISPSITAEVENTNHGSPSLKRPAGVRLSSQAVLPDFLPDEILAAEPMVRFPTPSPEPRLVKAPINKKQRFLEEKSRPPKDVRRGNVRIRVLEERQATLAPKVSKSSQMIRESWLAGRLGAKGRVVMERRKMGGGFVRK